MEPYVTAININLAGIRIRIGGKTVGEPPLLRERVSERERTRGLGSSKEPGRERAQWQPESFSDTPLGRQDLRFYSNFHLL